MGTLGAIVAFLVVFCIVAWAGALVVRVAVGCLGRAAMRARGTPPATPDHSGWVYFATPTGPGQEDAPIKIGMTRRDPRKGRLPELAQMNAHRLKLVYYYWVENARIEERRVHNLLALYRDHGEWYDRDATLAYIDDVKGARV